MELLPSAAYPTVKHFVFRHGLVGLPDLREFRLEVFAGLAGVAWYLRGSDGAGASFEFLLLNPAPFFPNYRPVIPKSDLELLELPSQADAAILVIATVPDDFRQMTANLRAPVVLNVTRGLGRQVILPSDEYAIRAPVFRTEAVPGGLR
ncbi:flagellar assembly protein FliW [Caldinitratiruptor microaerophilus]|uniref:Flagellar assembly factor FliW n=1 Tax=Caldinitratiruptor microaerophilus TaxID=671077 RepID=A0AA35CM57_9FIRM|nr:flagellar assembly protein FliW [Caldinitratiruptor microaerophilus]BDG61742.1 hypothetical protein caldi_28320 [Caldinitratiruptor microaerophilus]